jgi:hypothetical protein
MPLAQRLHCIPTSPAHDLPPETTMFQKPALNTLTKRILMTQNGDRYSANDSSKQLPKAAIILSYIYSYYSPQTMAIKHTKKKTNMVSVRFLIGSMFNAD